MRSMKEETMRAKIGEWALHSALQTQSSKLKGKRGPGGIVTDEAAQQSTLYPESRDKLGWLICRALEGLLRHATDLYRLMLCVKSTSS